MAPNTVQVQGVWASSAVRFAEGVLAVNIDVTEQRRREQELRDFAAVAAHDLREPLVGIAVMAEALSAASDLSAQRRGMAALMVDGVTHAKRLGRRHPRVRVGRAGGRRP